MGQVAISFVCVFMLILGTQQLLLYQTDDANGKHTQGASPTHGFLCLRNIIHHNLLCFQVAISYCCGNGMIEMLELLEDIPGIQYNIPDLEGNTALHFAAQAGHVEVVSFLLNKVRTINIDPKNIFGFTPLMKAAIQGRVKCSKLLLFSGECYSTLVKITLYM